MPKKTAKHPSKSVAQTSHKQSDAKPGASGQPIFAQPQPSPDPTGFKDPVTDQKEQELNDLEPVPAPAGGAAEPILTLQQVYGSGGAAKMQAIQNAGQIVFHSVGDTGSVAGPSTQSLVADKMVSDFDEHNAADVPSFLFHLGDVVYYFGEATYYYDQFYEPYRNYPAPIIAIPGNHDGVLYASDPEPTLDGFLRNFCTASAAQSPDSGGLLRTTMIQPGVYFTLEAPFRAHFGAVQQRSGGSGRDFEPDRHEQREYRAGSASSHVSQDCVGAGEKRQIRRRGDYRGPSSDFHRRVRARRQPPYVAGHR